MPKVIAHRGARSIAPENTLAAARIAFEMGADMWETDVTVSKDNYLVLFHDEFLDRCTDITSRFPNRPTTRLRDFYLKELLSLDAGSYFVQTDPFSQIKQGKVDSALLLSFKKERIPTLEQGLSLVRDMDWAVNLELKCHTPGQADCLVPEKTMDTIRKMGISWDRIVISSFHHDWLVRLEEKFPGLKVAALVGKKNMDILDSRDLMFDTYNVNADHVTDDQIRRLISRGRKVNLYTVNDPVEFKRLSALGVDGIFTDFPQLFCPPVL